MISNTMNSGKTGGVKLGFKLVIIFVVVLFLMIPLSMIGKIADERKIRAIDTENEIVGMNGGHPAIMGPVLIVPVRVREKTTNGSFIETRKRVAVLAKELDIKGSFSTEVRKRGIYGIPLIAGPVRVTADFADVPAQVAEALKGETYTADLENAWYTVELPDRRSLKSTPILTSNGGAARTMKGSDSSLGLSGTSMRERASLANGGAHVEITLELGGGGTLNVYPLGQTVRCEIDSDWKAPSFSGYVLPATREIGDKGFTASWYIPDSTQPYPRSYVVEDTELDLALSTFGVDFFQPISIYHQTERALKYGLLFVVLPFVVFFLFEVFVRCRIHPLQYAMIGLADVLFYLVLLSLSEHIPFMHAYAAGAIAVCLLVAFYSSAILQGWKRGLVMVPVLGGVYGYLYVALESEDYALLVGSIGVFAIVAFVMIVTRNIDWYALPAARSAGDGDEAEISVTEVIKDIGRDTLS